MTTVQGKQIPSAAKLAGKRVLVLGGTSGIGLAVATAAHEFGATVIVSSSSQTKIEAAIRRIESVGSGNRVNSVAASVQGYPCELGDLDCLESNLRVLLDSAAEGGRKKLDHIVYTAGNKAGSISLASTDTKTITDHGVLRFYVPIIVGKLAMDYANISPQSSITLTSGVNNVKPVPGRVLMAGWGAGVEGVTRALAVDLQLVRVNCICPGPTRTELFDSLPDEVLRPLLEKYKGSTMTRTIGGPEDVAEAYLYCMRDAFVDGTVIHSSGGYLLA
ncbi:short chain dehydrogenase [Trichoderma arundinaceum]|uniref:Short chain dehydrogenase n=1 Tax=Trichoderma arundinaceum TaxID=490622 RepID=A0A395N850_TRIAR|nr:short chain dehydrogenase [Trichoderma arundinaceum]